jgi:hypothetical protein
VSDIVSVNRKAFSNGTSVCLAKYDQRYITYLTYRTLVAMVIPRWLSLSLPISLTQFETDRDGPDRKEVDC